ncbi:MAG: hypothetical protein ACLGIT_05115 [Gammaproteobacteria bacterium]|uniref:hypothetical protein n=1 Tax=Azohydromonas sp. TaxID=1872666 RepID=UPI002B8D9FE3|nr:hypothetical protein [Azohydromonas sp.]HMM87106.1 hypothetical protein [Azohydromonas sp.]
MYKASLVTVQSMLDRNRRRRNLRNRRNARSHGEPIEGGARGGATQRSNSARKGSPSLLPATVTSWATPSTSSGSADGCARTIIA